MKYSKGDKVWVSISYRSLLGTEHVEWRKGRVVAEGPADHYLIRISRVGVRKRDAQRLAPR